MSFDRNSPYNALPPLPLELTNEWAARVETRRVLKEVIVASRELAELKGAGGAIPNQQILLTGILLQEARLSSEIENIVTTNDELYRANAGADLFMQASPHTKEVLRYREALWHGFQELSRRPLGTNLFVDIASIIKDQPMRIRGLPGTRLTGSDGRIVYTPPEGEERIRTLLGNLERFIHTPTGGLDPLIKLAMMHYQFEAIHPFTDGNGRTGRIINILFLIDKGLLELPVLYLSRYIINRKTQYYESLRRVTENGDWENWILYLLTGITETARDTRNMIMSIRDLMDAMTSEMQEKAPNVYSKDLLELIFEQPYCKIRFLENRGIARRQTASKYLKALAEAGLLHPVRSGREIYYINTRLIDVLAS